MDTKLDELKAKAEEMLKACRDENRKQETYEAVKAKLTGFLGDMKKLNDSDKICRSWLTRYGPRLFLLWKKIWIP